MKVLINRLEQILRHWEDTVYLENINAHYEQRYSPKPNPLVTERTLPWQQLRGNLLTLSPGEISEKYVEKPWADDALGSLATLPFELSDWTKHSRRVYYATNELQTLLALTSFERITWKDIPWPFSSFVIALEEPIVSEIHDLTGNIDTILVSRYERPEGGAVILLRFLSDDLDHKKLLSWFDRDQLERSLRKNPIRFATTRNAILEQRDSSSPVSCMAVFGEESLRDECVMDALDGDTLHNSYGLHDRDIGVMSEEYKKECRPVVDAAMRIVLGLCLYLTTLPAKSDHRSEWTPLPPSQKTGSDKSALSNGAEICTVSSIHRLTTEEQGVIKLAKRSFVEMAAHWRRGHWRRKPGEGNNPTAIKTVWVRPTLVRKDRLEPGQVTAGTLVVT